MSMNIYKWHFNHLIYWIKYDFTIINIFKELLEVFLRFLKFKNSWMLNISQGICQPYFHHTSICCVYRIMWRRGNWARVPSIYYFLLLLVDLPKPPIFQPWGSIPSKNVPIGTKLNFRAHNFEPRIVVLMMPK